jgi:4-carboxymuconolactone decarboxylase
MAPRIPLPASRDELDEAQRAVWDRVVSGPRGQVIGPLRAAIHNAELAARWSAMGEALRFNTSLPKRLSELAICVTGRRWSSQVEWWVHARDAFGVKGVVELTALIGYYTMVSMTLNAHGIPLPNGEAEPLSAPAEGLFALAPRDTTR